MEYAAFEKSIYPVKDPPFQAVDSSVKILTGIYLKFIG